jgi:hypothetical protein
MATELNHTTDLDGLHREISVEVIDPFGNRLRFNESLGGEP